MFYSKHEIHKRLKINPAAAAESPGIIPGWGREVPQATTGYRDP
jgi:hypothetical protein